MNSSWEDIFLDVIQVCLDRFDSNADIVPEARQLYLRVVAFIITLLDGEEEERDITKRKLFPTDRLTKLFKVQEF